MERRLETKFRSSQGYNTFRNESEVTYIGKGLQFNMNNGSLNTKLFNYTNAGPLFEQLMVTMGMTTKENVYT